MKNTLTIRKTAYDVINLGWNALTKALGPVEATRFWMLISLGEGDSVRDFKRMWKGMTVADLHREIIKAKKQGRI